MTNGHPAHPLVTLITDFGLSDEYVGVLKGVILSHNADIRIVDISHLVPAQDIQTASHLLARSYIFFPPRTVHLVIVDPGVGSDRPLLAIYSDSHYFVGPDNGTFTPIMKAAKSLSIHRITESDLFLHRVSNTFHGRDIMAPVAAQLATGLDICRVGARVTPEECLLSGPGSCSVIDGVLHGEITHVDKFGNLCTNISRNEVERFSGGKSIKIQIGGDGRFSVDTLCPSYASQTKGALLALYDSHDFLEIAENMGNASQRLRAPIGCRILLLLK
jgi:S-adenosyl-L-methionine hydrolase (adenosine-forming)